MFSSLNTLPRVQIRAANQCWCNRFLFQHLSLWPHSSFDPPRLHPVPLLLLQRGPTPNPAGEQGLQASPLLPVRFKIQIIWRFGNIWDFCAWEVLWQRKNLGHCTIYGQGPWPRNCEGPWNSSEAIPCRIDIRKCITAGLSTGSHFITMLFMWSPLHNKIRWINVCEILRFHGLLILC